MFLSIYLPAATKLGQGNIFTSVCQEFCPRGGGEGVCLSACWDTPPDQAPPPGTRHPSPPDQAPTPPDQAPTPPGPGTPPDQGPPRGQGEPPPGPARPTHPPGPGRPPPRRE